MDVVRVGAKYVMIGEGGVEEIEGRVEEGMGIISLSRVVMAINRDGSLRVRLLLAEEVQRQQNHQSMDLRVMLMLKWARKGDEPTRQITHKTRTRDMEMMTPCNASGRIYLASRSTTYG